IGLILTLAFGVLAGGAGYWQVIRSEELSSAPDNPAVIAAARQVLRGRIFDRDGTVLASNKRDSNGEPYRVYATPAVSQVVGYASNLYGSAGLERTFGAELTGLNDPDPIRQLLRKFQEDPSDPQSLTLSLSLPLQRAAIRGLGDDRGAVVMLDPRTGEILALASTPTYDASAISDPATARETFEALQADKARPLLPRATQGRYVPGSVFKIVTAIAALGSGAIEADTTFPNQRAAEREGLVVEGFRIREHAGVPIRTFDLAGATEVSSNIFFALAGLETGGGNLAEWAGRLGFGEPLDFDLPTAISQVTNGNGSQPGGFVDDVELANAAYGQAETFVTPLQMALVAATVANGGELMRPHLVTELTGKDGTRSIAPRSIGRIISDADADAITEAMIEAVEGDLGRRFTPGAKVPGILTAGKSGTAELGGKGEPHSWFIGFAPADNPEIAIAVLVERGGRGGERAAPLAGSLLETYFDSVAP
ncbi:MAG TPA: penicillin-binding transpeptidase domain-containing protein, partial [Candidatus Limnocylindrales bacterium]|nr:penicillin-binding transpeptidase domain-containing protein [Candidatus Limnocylindrales bacterium]